LPWILSPGYFRNPDATLAAWRNLWFHTGDSGYIDADGWVYFVDRLGDRIRRRAESVSSYDIEIAANRYPAILESAAIGVPSEFASDDDVKLCVVLRSGFTFDERAFLSFLAKTLPYYMLPRYIERLETLPRTPTQKVGKSQLRSAGITARTWDRKQHDVDIRTLVDSSPTC
jgi:crotonobetaine/carnitine-CoA ligase